jgi:hypothetical protein
MIRVSKEHIRFTLPGSSLIGQPEHRQVLERDLISAHVCSHCGVLVQAVYKTDRRVEELSQEFFGLDKPMKPGRFATATARHEVQPKYKSYLVTVNGQAAEILRESYHWSLTEGSVAGRCKITRCVYKPGPFDLQHYIFAAGAITMGEFWNSDYGQYWRRMRLCLQSDNQELNQRNLGLMFGALRPKLNIAQDVTGNGPDMWMLSKSDGWGYNGYPSAINDLQEP